MVLRVSLFDPNNPNAAFHLRRLAESLPAMAMRQTKRGLKREQGSQFTRCCPVCNEFYRHKQTASKIVVPDTLKAENCPSCAEVLAEGYTALVTASHRHLFVKLGGERAGQISTITENEMNVFQARHAAQQIWDVVVKECGAHPSGAVDFFAFALKADRPFCFPFGKYGLRYSQEGVPSVEHLSGGSEGLEAANQALLALIS